MLLPWRNLETISMVIKPLCFLPLLHSEERGEDKLQRVVGQTQTQPLYVAACSPTEPKWHPVKPRF